MAYRRKFVIKKSRAPAKRKLYRKKRSYVVRKKYVARTPRSSVYRSTTVVRRRPTVYRKRVKRVAPRRRRGLSMQQLQAIYQNAYKTFVTTAVGGGHSMAGGSVPVPVQSNDNAMEVSGTLPPAPGSTNGGIAMNNHAISDLKRMAEVDLNETQLKIAAGVAPFASQ